MPQDNLTRITTANVPFWIVIAAGAACIVLAVPLLVAEQWNNWRTRA